jgi:hypothetical protein
MTTKRRLSLALPAGVLFFAAMLFPWGRGMRWWVGTLGGLLGALGWIFALHERGLREDQDRTVRELILPDGSYLASIVPHWTLFFPKESKRAGMMLGNMNDFQVGQLRRAWEEAIAEAAEKIYVGDFAPQPVPGRSDERP